MLFLPPASSRFIRVHAPYISEQESARLASFLRKQGKPVYDASITAEEKSMLDGIEMDKDDLYDEAARIVVRAARRRSRICSAAADRLQPRGAAGRHDGDGRAGVAGRRRQASRGAGRQGSTSKRWTRN
jgi:DNA segregation ATPase FtsK/SpoIIIE-like protein